MTATPVDLSVRLGSLTLKNPVLLASGTVAYGEELAPLVPLDRVGALITKSITLRPRPGNPPYRVVETPAGMLNSIGLQNVGVEAFIRDKLPFLRQQRACTIVNVAGFAPAEYGELVTRLDGLPGVQGFELNISCPNTRAEGLEIGLDPTCTAEAVAAARKATRLPLITKLSPNVTDIRVLARAAVESGSDALSVTNTFVGMAVDVEKRRPVLSTVTGGVSGPAIKPLALRLVWEVARAVTVPIIGVGGILTVRDALEFLLVGATAVQVGTANFANPSVSLELIEGLEAYCREHTLRALREVVGTLEVPA